MNDPGPIQDLGLRREIAYRMEFVRRYTHCILTKTEIGTGVTFRLGERLFLSTAGHVLKPPFEVHLFAGEGPAIQAEVLSHYAHPDCMSTTIHADVGFVEVTNVPRVAACAIDQLHIGAPTPAVSGNVLLFVAGCPGVGYAPQARPPEVGLAVFGTYLLGGNERVLELEYERTGHAVSPDGGTFGPTEFFETPGGFSGGGVWTMLKANEGELFVPERHIMMNGTQFQWNPRTRVLQAMRPRFSLPFFFECYPDLLSEYGYVLNRL
jgi:hypothetical protein